MRALLLKEFRQGRPLLLFALALGVLLAAGYWAFHGAVYYRFHARDLRQEVGWLAFSGTVALAFFAGAGLFAGETSAGTLPHLLALPLSRRRIWLAKLAGGFALSIVATAVLLGLAALLAPQAVIRGLPLRAYAWDLVCWSLTAFAAAVFASALVSSTTGALGLSIVLVGALAGAACYGVLVRGALLLGYAEGLDVAVWCLLVSPVLVGVSVWLVQRGELLRARRRWWQGALLLIAGTLAVVLIVTGVCRVATRYRRARVVEAGAYSIQRSGPTSLLAVASRSSPVRVGRAPGWGWVRRGSAAPEGTPPPEYRSDYTVVLRSDSGREVGHWRTAEGYGRRGDVETAWSRDGRRLAVLRDRDGLTWGSRTDTRAKTLLLLDAETGRALYSGWPRGLPQMTDAFYEIGFSPDGRYLAVQASDESHSSFSILDERGNVLRTLRGELQDVAWSPVADSVYGVDMKQRLVRVDPTSGASHVIWRDPSATATDLLWLRAFSPDDRWLLIEERATDRPQATGVALWAVNTTRGEGTRLYQYSEEYPSRCPADWTGDSRALYLVVPDQPQGPSRVLRWPVGGTAPQPVSAAAIGPGTSIHVVCRPGTDQVVLWMSHRRPLGGKRVREGGRVLLLDSQGRAVRESPAGRYAKDYWPVAFDPKGRALLSPDEGRDILSVDLDTGEAKRLYP